jgi:hypothetical protein
MSVILLNPNQTVGATNQLPANWKPVNPKIQWFYQGRDGRYLITRLIVNVAPGVNWSFQSQTDLAEVEKAIRYGQAPGVGSIFGKIAKGVKGAVKSVGKATGLNKVVAAASKVINNPIIKAVVPGASAAAAALKVTQTLTTATAAAAAKDPRATKLLAGAAVQAKAAGLNTSDLKNLAGKTYKLIISEN